MGRYRITIKDRESFCLDKVLSQVEKRKELQKMKKKGNTKDNGKDK